MAEKERRRSHDRRKTQARAYLDELRGLGVDVEEFLKLAVAAESAAKNLVTLNAVSLRVALPVLIHRNCLASPSVLKELHALLILGSDDKTLRRIGDLIGKRQFSAGFEKESK